MQNGTKGLGLVLSGCPTGGSIDGSRGARSYGTAINGRRLREGGAERPKLLVGRRKLLDGSPDPGNGQWPPGSLDPWWVRLVAGRSGCAVLHPSIVKLPWFSE